MKTLLPEHPGPGASMYNNASFCCVVNESILFFFLLIGLVIYKHMVSWGGFDRSKKRLCISLLLPLFFFF